MATPQQKTAQDRDAKAAVSVEASVKMQGDKDRSESRSHTSSSRRSVRSALSVSMAATKARAEAEAAKARASFSQREMEIKLQKAKLEAELVALNQLREAEAAVAKAVCMEAAVIEYSRDGSLEEFKLLPKAESAHEKVSEYVVKHTQMVNSQPEEEELDMSQQSQQPSNLLTLDEVHGSPSPPQQRNCPVPGIQQHSSPRHVHYCHSQSHRPGSQQDVLEPSVQRYQGLQPVSRLHGQGEQATSHYTPNSSPSHDVSSSTSDLAKFLIRSQLVSGGLTKFDDQPENYLSWRSTFTSVVNNLDLSPHEQIDLLIKWLGPESSQLARRDRKSVV